MSWGSQEGQKEAWPGYSERATSLVCRIWPQQEKLPYAVLSAVAHAELLGLARNLPAPGTVERTEDAVRPAASPAGFWAWHDAYLILGALVFAGDRAASFLGLEDQLAALHSWTGELDHALPGLRPGTP